MIYLLNKDNCERQFAWKTQYGIPKEQKESDPFPMKVGISFHKFSGMMLLNNENPQKSGEIDRLKNLLKAEDEEVAKGEGVDKVYDVAEGEGVDKVHKLEEYYG